MGWVRCVGAALLLVQIGGCATGQSVQTRSVTVNPGVPVKVGASSQWDSTCHMIHIPTITVDEAPKNGTTEVKRTINRLGGGTVVGSNPCAGQEIEGAGLFYTSNPGFHGQDHLRYTAFTQGNAGLPGNSFPTVLDITVK